VKYFEFIELVSFHKLTDFLKLLNGIKLVFLFLFLLGTWHSAFFVLMVMVISEKSFPTRRIYLKSRLKKKTSRLQNLFILKGN